jgi:hypothetical protein
LSLTVIPDKTSSSVPFIYVKQFLTNLRLTKLRKHAPAASTS